MVDGAVGKDKLDEFRNNNIQLQQQIDKFKNIDPAKHQELLELQRKLQEEELIEKGEVEKLVNLRVTKMKESSRVELTDATYASSRRPTQQLGVLLVDNVVKSAAIQAGMHPMAVDDVLLRARGVYTVARGQAGGQGRRGQDDLRFRRHDPDATQRVGHGAEEDRAPPVPRLPGRRRRWRRRSARRERHGQHVRDREDRSRSPANGRGTEDLMPPTNLAKVILGSMLGCMLGMSLVLGSLLWIADEAQSRRPTCVKPQNEFFKMT
jgi:hypothetical protein